MQMEQQQILRRMEEYHHEFQHKKKQEEVIHFGPLSNEFHPKGGCEKFVGSIQLNMWLRRQSRDRVAHLSTHN